jgi:regulator of protease activity HflC (stomatin/prohibitin superfamily)
MEIIYIATAITLLLIFLSITVVKQGSIAVVTIFGKYSRIMYPGINLKWPVVENIFKKISIQNQSFELEFSAITFDQANVNFKTLILFAAKDQTEETIKKIAFRFIDEKSFTQTLIRSVEGSIRAFVATKKQFEILVLRKEIVHAVVEHLENSLNDWGFHLLDLQVNDISFDEAIMRSMAQVVASNNMKMAAENEAQAQYITKTRAAEAEARAIKTKAEAHKDADELKGVGNALFRENVAAGLAKAGNIMESNNVEPTFMLFTMWLDGMKHISEHSKGNILSFDGSNDGFEKNLKQMQMMNRNMVKETSH